MACGSNSGGGVSFSSFHAQRSIATASSAALAFHQEFCARERLSRAE
jgi:hypothetical protein